MSLGNPSATQQPCPILSEDLRIEESGGDVVVFDQKRGQFHLLNGVAHRILTLCNGVTSPPAIASALAHSFDLQGRSLAAVTQDVVAALSQLRAKGLIQVVNPMPDLLDADGPLLGAKADSLLAVVVHGASMFPALLSGDRIVVKRAAPEEVHIGDVVVWAKADGRLVAHRVRTVEREPTVILTTKGDTAPDADDPVSFDRVLGKAVAVLREGRVHWLGDQAAEAVVGTAGSSTEEVPPSTAGSSGLSAEHNLSGLKVLDLRGMSPAAVRSLESVCDVSVVLLSEGNADAWCDVTASRVGSVLTVPDDYRVYTGQPEVLPEMLEYLGAPLRIVVSGQLFLSRFDASQVPQVFEHVILSGQAYVSSLDAKAALAKVTQVIAGDILVVAAEHRRWIGHSIVGPELERTEEGLPLVAVGNVSRSKRLQEVESAAPQLGESHARSATR